MKFVLTNKENEIIEISNTYEVDEEHRNINVDNYAIAYAPDEKINVFEVEEIPEGVERAKYCYTEEQGFYINENYVEPVNEKSELEKVKEENRKLRKELDITQMAVAEICESILNKEV